MWFIGVEVEKETSAPPPKKNPGSVPETFANLNTLKVQNPKTFMNTEKTSFRVDQP